MQYFSFGLFLSQKLSKINIPSPSTRAGPFVSLIILCLNLIYWVTLDYMLRQSIGKALLNIYVRSTEKELKLWQCIVRNIPKLSLILLFLDSFGVLFRNEYQRYFEKLSKTEVVDGEI